MTIKKLADFFAILAAVLYSVNIPLRKLILQVILFTIVAAFLYLDSFGLLGIPGETAAGLAECNSGALSDAGASSCNNSNLWIRSAPST